MGEELLTVENLAVARGGVPLLAGVSFAVAAGEALVLRGPNGIGKTSLLRTLAGLQPAVAGTVSVDDPVYAAHLDGLKATLTARENLKFWADLHGGADVDAALRAFNLSSLAERPAGQLSAGQKRRLGLARLLVSGRSIWLLDEPTVSLDREAVRQFAGVVSGHLKAGGAAVIATHIDLGLDAREMDLNGYRAEPETEAAFDGAFL